MSTPSQITANRENAKHSTGPATPEGKARSSRNAIKLGLFTANAFVFPDQQPRYDAICQAFMQELKPNSPSEDILTLEVIRAAWRLEICGNQEARLAEMIFDRRITPETLERQQRMIDRARSASLNIMRRARKEIADLQSERRKQEEADRKATAPEPAKTKAAAVSTPAAPPAAQPPQPAITAPRTPEEVLQHWRKSSAA